MSDRPRRAADVIARIMADERMRTSSHFSERVYTDEPILTTGRQMASYLPDRYREMRAISRWETKPGAARGRWLSEAELFWRQGTFMADWEDDCPYRGAFKSYYPTYSAMSDRQLRGYFTWRAHVRAGHVEQTSLSFAYVYLYELLGGIGVASPREGYERFLAFWQAYRAFAPELDRHARIWLADYVIYHGLDRELLEPIDLFDFDERLIALERAERDTRAWIDAQGHREGQARQKTGRRRAKAGTLIPPNPELERRLADAIDALSTYRLSRSRLGRERGADLAHVASAVYLRLGDHYRTQRHAELIPTLFGNTVELPYTMFAGAVFHEATPHADTQYVVNEKRAYRCERGLWSCCSPHGTQTRNAKLGCAMRAADRALREHLDPDHPLSDDGKTPKYVQRIAEQEAERWISWAREHAPRRISIDLSQLDGIRHAAARTREALLIEEERSGHGALVEGAEPEPHDETMAVDAGIGERAHDGTTDRQPDTAPTAADARTAGTGTRATAAIGTPNAVAAPLEAMQAPPSDAPATPPAASDGPLTPHQTAYLRALASGAPDDERTALAQQAGVTEDMLIDAINEALFDLIGDTVIEYGPLGPSLIEDYRPDVEEIVHHG